MVLRHKFINLHNSLYLAHIIDDKLVDKTNGDVNKDSKFNIIDATYIQMSLARVSNIDGTLPYVKDHPKNPVN